jgi:hypothetical protein
MRTTILALASVALSACTITTTAGNPHPNVALLARPATSLALVISDSVRDESYRESSDVRVTQLRTTLRNGFTNGFHDYFALARAGEPASFTLQLERADIDFPVMGRGMNVTVTYRARLLNAAGATVEVAAGTAINKKSSGFTDDGGFNDALTGAVESMYEELTEKLLRSATAPCPPTSNCPI